MKSCLIFKIEQYFKMNFVKIFAFVSQHRKLKPICETEEILGNYAA